MGMGTLCVIGNHFGKTDRCKGELGWETRGEGGGVEYIDKF